jgi:hypothetical protein
MRNANESQLKQSSKKTYKSPIMTDYGTVENKTMTGSSGTSDGDSASS